MAEDNPRDACPDGGRCWHSCQIIDGKGLPCWRVSNAAPFSDEYPREEDGVWPLKIQKEHHAAAVGKAYAAADYVPFLPHHDNCQCDEEAKEALGCEECPSPRLAEVIPLVQPPPVLAIVDRMHRAAVEHLQLCEDLLEQETMGTEIDWSAYPVQAAFDGCHDCVAREILHVGAPILLRHLGLAD